MGRTAKIFKKRHTVIDWLEERGQKDHWVGIVEIGSGGTAWERGKSQREIDKSI